MHVEDSAMIAQQRSDAERSAQRSGTNTRRLYFAVCRFAMRRAVLINSR